MKDFLERSWNLYYNFIGKTNYLLFLLVAFSLAMPYSIMRTIWTLWLVSWALEFRFLFRKNIHLKKEIIPILVLGLYFLWQGLSYFWATNPLLATKTLERQVSFIVLPLIALFGVNKNYNIKQISQWFVVGVFLTTLWYLTISLFMDNYQTILQNKPYASLNTDTFVRTFEFFFCKLKHRFFFATAAMLASIVLIRFFKNFKEKIGIFYTWIFTISFFVSTISVVLLSGSRASIITYLLIIFVSLCSYFAKKRKWIPLASGIIVVCCVFFLFYSYHPRMENIDVDKLRNPEIVEKGDEPRFAIWHSAITHIDEYILTGKGVGNSVSFLKEKFKENNYPKVFIEKNFHSHNQYIEVLIESGVVGLLLLLATFLSLIKYSKQGNKKIAFYIVLIFLINSLSDTIIRPLEGVVLFCFTSLFLLILNKEEEKI